MSAERPVLLTIQHVPWEGPHRIADACGALDLRRAALIARSQRGFEAFAALVAERSTA